MLIRSPKVNHPRLADHKMTISSRIALSKLNSPTVFETQQGAQGAIIYVQGYPIDVMNPEDIHHSQGLLTTLLMSLSDEFTVYVTTFRRRHLNYPAGEFAPGFAQDFNQAYQSKLLQRSFYTNEHYITIIIRGADSHLQPLSAFYREQQQQKLHDAVQKALQLLQALKPRLLSDVAGPQCRAEILNFFGWLINGESQQFCHLQRQLAHFLPTRRLLFSQDTLEWLGNQQAACRLASMLTVKQYHAQTNAITLDSLFNMDFEYVNTHSFACQTSSSLGQHHHSILVFAANQAELVAHIAALTQHYHEANLVLERESLQLERLFWAQLPGNFSDIADRSLISAEDFANLCPLYHYPSGYFNQNHLGSAVMMVDSSHHTPLYINFHQQTSDGAHDLSTGHTTIVAATAADKTTFMLACDAQAKKYATTSFFFDCNRDCERYVHAMNGFYNVIHPEQPTGFNPLALEDTPHNRQFLMIWLSSLLMQNEQDSLSATEFIQVGALIVHNYKLPLAQRNLSTLAQSFPGQFPRLTQLQPWLRSNDWHQSAGRLAYLFDHDQDSLSVTHATMGFDMTHLLVHETPEVMFSVMLYVLHRITELMDGRLIGIYLNEAWQLLNHAHWRNTLRHYLTILRQLNTYVVFATQTPSSVIQSSLHTQLSASIATQIFLPNTNAKQKEYCDHCQLSSAELTVIKNLLHQHFLVKQGHDSAIGHLNLTGLADFLAVFSVK